MTSVLKRIGIITIALALLLSTFAACNNTNSNEEETESETVEEEATVVYTLTLSADKSEATRGESVNLSAILKAEGAEDIPSEDTDFILVSGSEYATITENVLKISETAPHGATITVQAKEGASYSNTVTIKVNVPLKSIVISAATEKPTAGQTLVLTKVVDPADATQTISWQITEGADLATISGDAITIKEDAAIGSVIKIKAVSGDIESNELTLTVRSAVDEIPAESVVITAPTLNPLVGESVIITGQIKPDNSTDTIKYEIIDGGDFATLSGNVLIISKEATAGVVIKVVASAGNAKSNELLFTVRDGKIAAESIEIYANNYTPLPGQSVVISKNVMPQNTTDSVTWAIIEGADYAEMAGDVLMVKNTVAAGSVIKVKATAGSKESNVLEFVVASDEIKATKVTISADYTNLLPGQTLIIQSTVTPADSTDDVVLSLTAGSEYASLAGNVLVVHNNAPAGTVIKVIAKAGSVDSNELEFVVRDTSKPATKIEISADNLKPIAGHSVTINYNIEPVDTTDKLTWVIVEGSDIAAMAGNVLVIKADAEKDSIVKVKATAGNKESNVLEFNVRPAVEEIKVESIQISATTEVLRGQTYAINKIINPNNANQEVVLQFVKGGAYARFHGDAIIISETASTGTEITIVATTTDGSVKSNEITFVVQPSQEEINANKFYIDFETPDTFTLDKKGTAATPSIIAGVYNYNYDPVSDKELVYRVVSGAEFLGITVSGNECKLSDIKGHGTAVVEVGIKGTSIVETVTVNVIVPPDAVIIPEVFLERTDIEYSFSMIDHEIGIGSVTEKGAASLPFAPTVRGNGACQDLSFSFRHENGKTGDEVAVYANGAITFKMTGKVTVIVSSASGSKVEASTSYVFNINKGINVNSFVEAHYVLYATYQPNHTFSYRGEMINFVILEKPVGATCTVPGCYCGNKAYEYGYSLVPPVALKDHKDQTVYEIISGHAPGEDNGMESNRLQAVNTNLYINGNSHVVDVSQIRIFSEAEHNAYCNEYGRTGNPNIGSLISAEPWYSGGENAGSGYNKQSYEVKLYNVETKGNASIDYDPTMWREAGTTNMRVGIFETGINIGITAYDCHYYIDADNVTSSGFANGLSFTGVVGNGKVRNVTAYNCYVNGILSRGNIMTLENVTFGRCGATGIELAPEESAESGILDNENQQVTISGVINAKENVNAGNTTYFQNYQIGQGVTVPMIINGNAAGIIEAAKKADPYGQGEAAGNNAVAHIRNANGEFIFVSLKFVDLATIKPNPSTVIYPNYQEGGIITVEQLLTDILTKSKRDPSTGAITKMYVDTTHQFIEMPIQVTGMGTVGTALFYNHNYGK